MFKHEYLSIDIGNQVIKLLYGHYRSAQLRIKGFSLLAVPENSVQEGRLINTPEIAHRLANEIKNNSFNPKEIVFTLAGSSVISRIIQLPKSTEKEVKQILAFEASQFFPIDLKDYVFDYRIMDDINTREGEFTRIMLIAIPEKQADEYMELGALLGIKVAAITAHPDCMFKLVAQKHLLYSPALLDKGQDANYVIIDLGQWNVKASIFSRQILQSDRTLPVGIRDLDTAIMQTLQMDAAEADTYKRNRLDLANNEDITLATNPTDAIQAVIMKILYDVNRFIDFYKSNNYAQDIDKIYLCGGGSQIMGISTLVSQYFNTEVEVIEKSQIANLIYKKAENQSDFEDKIRFLIPAMGALIR